MLLNAFLACGARHLTLVNPAYSEDKALNYYDTATRLILASLQNGSRETEICATTAIILNVYEIMSEKPLQRMNHIAGARALLQECGWNARTPGVGGACFWLNVTMELLSCLRFGWPVAWNPDDWNVDLDFDQQCEPGKEEVWAHRIIYILAKIANFRAESKCEAPVSAGGFMDTEATTTTTTTEKRYEQWRRLRDQCRLWNDRVPRNMQPMAYLYPYQATNKSAFPEVWLIKRCATVARLFYHTAMILVAQSNPYHTDDMRELSLEHAHQVCGIAAHVKDRGVASVALRSLATAAECLEDRREQEEVLGIFTKIRKETGWKVGFIFKELKERWRWDVPQQPTTLLQAASDIQNGNSNTLQYNRYQCQQQQPSHQPQQQRQQQSRRSAVQSQQQQQQQQQQPSHQPQQQLSHQPQKQQQQSRQSAVQQQQQQQRQQSHLLQQHQTLHQQLQHPPVHHQHQQHQQQQQQQQQRQQQPLSNIRLPNISNPSVATSADRNSHAHSHRPHQIPVPHHHNNHYHSNERSRYMMQ